MTWKSEELFDFPEQAAVHCEDVHRVVEQCWKLTGRVDIVELPEGRNLN
jgi:hypothetical protein